MCDGRHSERRGVVVVGVDGSAGARDALRWAVAEARFRQTRLRVVHAWTFGYPGAIGGAYGYPYVGGAIDTLPGEGFNDLQQAAADLVDQAVTDVVAGVEGLEIEREAVEGGAAQVLVNAVSESDLLVVGSRGHGGVAGLMLGSVSQQCAHHASCPVVIVPPARHRRVGGGGSAPREGTRSQSRA
jgi:nucleotide-binding universal stress UspA family protein